MKNLAILTLVLGVFIFATSSCKKISEPNAVNVIENAGTATIKGFAYAQIVDTVETTNFTNAQEFAPAGTKIIVKVSQNQFPGVSTYGSNSNELVYETTVGADGKWSVDVKAPKTAITATVYPQDFYATLVTGSCSTCSDPNTVYSESNYSVSVIEGSAYILDLYYAY